MSLKEFVTHRLIKSEDLNHHGTLFAGRSAEWFVESAFIAATELVKPQNLVCVKVHGMHFSKPVRLGDIIKLSSKVVYAGKTSIVTYTKVSLRGEEQIIVDGFISFVHVDNNTKPSPHGLIIKPSTEDEKRLFEEAKKIKR
jgi:acyl-CoA hydrolase